jgi:hypothetical protein
MRTVHTGAHIPLKEITGRCYGRMAGARLRSVYFIRRAAAGVARHQFSTLVVTNMMMSLHHLPPSSRFFLRPSPLFFILTQTMFGVLQKEMRGTTRACLFSPACVILLATPLKTARFVERVHALILEACIP